MVQLATPKMTMIIVVLVIDDNSALII